MGQRGSEAIALRVAVWTLPRQPGSKGAWLLSLIHQLHWKRHRVAGTKVGLDDPRALPLHAQALCHSKALSLA